MIVWRDMLLARDNARVCDDATAHEEPFEMITEPSRWAVERRQNYFSMPSSCH